MKQVGNGVDNFDDIFFLFYGSTNVPLNQSREEFGHVDIIRMSFNFLLKKEKSILFRNHCERLSCNEISQIIDILSEAEYGFKNLPDEVAIGGTHFVFQVVLCWVARPVESSNVHHADGFMSNHERIAGPNEESEEYCTDDMGLLFKLETPVYSRNLTDGRLNKAFPNAYSRTFWVINQRSHRALLQVIETFQTTFDEGPFRFEIRHRIRLLY